MSGFKKGVTLCKMLFQAKEETQRRLETWIKEHKDACKKGYTKKSAIAEQAQYQQHTIDWEEVWMLDRATRPVQLLSKVTLCVRAPSQLDYDRS